MKILISIINIIIIFIIIISCNSADPNLGINTTLLEEEESSSSSSSSSSISNYYADIATAMADGVIAYWKMDESGGGTAYEETGSYDGIINNLNNVSGKFGNAYYFKGAGTDSNINVSTISHTGGTYTFSFWAYIQNYTDTQYFFESYNPYIRLALYGNATTPRLYLTYGGTTRYFGNVADPRDFLNSWAHIVYVLDGGSSKAYLYVNGTNVYASGETYASTNLNGANERIGSRYNGTAYNFEGNIDDFAIWTRALSASEIAAIYNSNASLTP